MSEKSVEIGNAASMQPKSAEQIKPEECSSGITRSGLVDQLGISRPSGDLEGDLKGNKRVLLERGISIRAAKSEPDMGENIVQFVACTEGIKRDGNRVRNDGWSFDNFAKNPQFLWAHDYGSLPIGKHVDWKVDKVDGEPVLRLWSKFCSEDLYPFADKVRKMYEQGFLRAGSIGWIPLEYETIVDKNGYTVGFDFTKNDLLEFSAVPVPSDPNALIEAVQRGVLSSEDMEKLVRNGKGQENLGVSYRLSNQDHAPEAVSEKEVTIVDVEENKEIPYAAGDVEQREIADICLEDSMEQAELEEEISQELGAECVPEAEGEIEARDESPVETEVEAPVEAEMVAADDAVAVEDSEVRESDTVETAEESEVEESSEERGGMDGEEYEEDHEEEEHDSDIKEELVSVLQEASKEFTTTIISAVMSVLGDSVQESSAEEVEDADLVEPNTEERASDEISEAEALIDELIGADESYTNSVEPEAETRIGAKVSKENKDRLCRCRDRLSEVVSDLDSMLEERKHEEDHDSGSMEVEVPEKDETTFAADGEEIENGVDWGRAVEMADKIKRDLGLIEGAEPEVEESSIGTFSDKAREILRSLGGGSSESKEENTEVKSEYLKELVRRVKSNKEKI